MIAERELRQIAGKTGLGIGQTAHEYAMLCVLDALGQTSLLSDTFCLKGGTALRLTYFNDWRHSVDLDFSVLPTFPSEELRTHVERWFAQVDIAHGMTVRLLDFHRANGAARMRAQFVGPLRHPARLLFDVILDEPVLLPPQRREVVVSFFPALRPVVLTYALEEILAEKMRSILQRGKSRDYYDVWRLLREKKQLLMPPSSAQLWNRNATTKVWTRRTFKRSWRRSTLMKRRCTGSVTWHGRSLHRCCPIGLRSPGSWRSCWSGSLVSEKVTGALLCLGAALDDLRKVNLAMGCLRGRNQVYGSLI